MRKGGAGAGGPPLPAYGCAAFLCGAICALLAVAVAFLVRKPDAPGMSGAH